MRILFIGGTRFYGRLTVQEALDRGHQVTLFHRGQPGETLFSEAEHVHGDRFTHLDRVARRGWDAVVDLFAYVPRAVDTAATALGPNLGRYWLVSSVAAYRPSRLDLLDEEAPIYAAADLDDPAAEQVDFATTFGPLKALCERAARAALGDRVSILRPTFLVGPGDHTDRFTWWVRRLARGGTVLAPGPAGAASQILDARDLARFTLDLIERDAPGTWNASGPSEPRTFGQLLEGVISALGSDATLAWVSPEFLTERGVVLGAELGVHLPLWVGEPDDPRARCSPAAALAAGLHCRPLAETVRDTLAWDRGRGTPESAIGLSPEREEQLIGEWRARNRTGPN